MLEINKTASITPELFMLASFCLVSFFQHHGVIQFKWKEMKIPLTHFPPLLFKYFYIHILYAKPRQSLCPIVTFLMPDNRTESQPFYNGPTVCNVTNPPPSEPNPQS